MNTFLMCRSKIKTVNCKKMKIYWIYKDDQPENIRNCLNMYNCNLLWYMGLTLSRVSMVPY